MKGKIFSDDHNSNITFFENLLKKNHNEKEINNKFLLGSIAFYVLSIFVGAMIFSIMKDPLIIGLLSTIPSIPSLFFINKIRKNDNHINRAKQSISKINQQQITGSIVFSDIRSEQMETQRPSLSSAHRLNSNTLSERRSN